MGRLCAVAAEDRGRQGGQGLLGRGAGPCLGEGLAGHQGGVDGGAVVGDEGGRFDAEVAGQRRADLGGWFAREQAGADLVDDQQNTVVGDAQLAELLPGADEVVQADWVGAGDGDDQVGVGDGAAGDGVAAEADLVVEELLVLFEAEAEVDDGEREGDPEQVEQGLPGAEPDFGPELGAG